METEDIPNLEPSLLNQLSSGGSIYLAHDAKRTEPGCDAHHIETIQCRLALYDSTHASVRDMTLRRKTVHVNDVPIGEASTWEDVRALLRAKGIWFLGKPGAAEGPTGFFLQGTTSIPDQRRGRFGHGR
jgi:hypothetical protein